MASRFVHKFLLGPVLRSKVLCSVNKATVSAGIKNLSTQPHLEGDVEKLAADNGPSPWKLCAAVCLVRLPVLEDALNDLEERYLSMKDRVEYEQSVLSNWELEDHRQQQLIKDIEAGVRNPEDVDFKETNQDLEDSYDANFNEFKETISETNQADDDKQNVNRRPCDSLILITKQQLGSDMVWVLPTVEQAGCQTMKESAVQALQSHCGHDTGALFTSNAPSGFYKYKFPKGARNNECIGAKLFIYNAFLPRNSETHATYTFDSKMVSKSVLDHAWIARDEMRAYMKPKYIAAIDKIILKW